MGSAKLVLESGKHPGQLKDEVCSPFGSTIRGVVVLEKGAFRGTVIDALRTTIARAFAVNRPKGNSRVTNGRAAFAFLDRCSSHTRILISTPLAGVLICVCPQYK